MESPDSSFVIDPSQVTGEIAERGQISIIITRKVRQYSHVLTAASANIST